MNPTDYIFLLSHPEAVNERQTDALEKIVTEFPYFQSARALRLKGLYNQNSFQYNYALKVTAAYTTDRSVLFEFITSDSFTAIQKGLYEEKLAEIEGITVKDSLVVTDEEKTVERPSDTELAKQSIRESIRESENRVEADEKQPETPLAETINPEDFGPISEEPQFLPEAIAPVEFTHIETVEFVRAEPEVSDVEAETAPIADEPMATVVEETIPIVEAAEPQSERLQNAEDIAETTHEEVQATEIGQIEQRLDIGKPLEFSKDETHSFQEWLQLSKLQPIIRDEIAPETQSTANIPGANDPDLTSQVPEKETPVSEKISKDALIDRFIEANPKMPKVNSEAKPMTIEPKEDTSALMTETLARVYLEQRKYQKAIQAYEILILKYPEKSSFFADRISEIKNLQQNNIL